MPLPGSIAFMMMMLLLLLQLQLQLLLLFTLVVALGLHSDALGRHDRSTASCYQSRGHIIFNARTITDGSCQCER